MSKPRTVLATAVVLLFVPSVARAQEPVACTVNGDAILQAEFDAMIEASRRQYADNDRAFPRAGSPELEGLYRDLVEYLVMRELIEQQGARFGITVSERAIDAGYRNLVAQFGSEQKLTAELERLGMTMERVRADIRHDVLNKRLYERVVANVVVTDAEIGAYFRAHPSQFTRRPSRRVAHIVVRTKVLADQVHRATAPRGMTLFARYARRVSIDPSTSRTGGVLAIQRGQTVRAFDRVAFRLATGEQSAPVRTTYGWHVIRAISDVRPGRRLTIGQAYGRIKVQLRGEQEGEAYFGWQRDIRNAAIVTCAAPYVWSQTVTETVTLPAG